MDNAYWSIENAGWTSPSGALVTPWSGHVLPLPAVTPPLDAAAVLRMPSRQQLAAGAVPHQREQTGEPAHLERSPT